MDLALVWLEWFVILFPVFYWIFQDIFQVREGGVGHEVPSSEA